MKKSPVPFFVVGAVILFLGVAFIMFVTEMIDRMHNTWTEMNTLVVVIGMTTVISGSFLYLLSFLASIVKGKNEGAQQPQQQPQYHILADGTMVQVPTQVPFRGGAQRSQPLMLPDFQTQGGGPQQFQQSAWGTPPTPQYQQMPQMQQVHSMPQPQAQRQSGQPPAFW